jgi:hypothetical protein
MKVVPEDTFWLDRTGSRLNASGRHLFVCVAASKSSPAEYLLVPVCSWTQKSDPTCRLFAADHDELTHDSFVAYHLMRVVGQTFLDTADFGNQITHAKKFDAILFGKICAGVAMSVESHPTKQTFYATHK